MHVHIQIISLLIKFELFVFHFYSSCVSVSSAVCGGKFHYILLSHKYTCSSSIVHEMKEETTKIRQEACSYNVIRLSLAIIFESWEGKQKNWNKKSIKKEIFTLYPIIFSWCPAFPSIFIAHMFNSSSSTYIYLYIGFRYMTIIIYKSFQFTEDCWCVQQDFVSVSSNIYEGHTWKNK